MKLKKIRNFLSRLGLYGLLFVVILFPLAAVSGFRAAQCRISGNTIPNEWTLDMGSEWEVEYISAFWRRNDFLNLNGFMRRFLGQREMNDVIKLNNGYLARPVGYVSDEELEPGAASLANLDRYLTASDAEFLVAVAPDSISKYDPQLPAGMEDYVNDDLDRMIRMLTERGVEAMDFREVIHEDGIDQYTLMYKTDHHWTTRAGFYAYGKLADWIAEKTGVKVDEKIRDIENYSVTTYEGWHLGSYGQRTGRLYAGIDDFELILPKFDTKITNGEVTGTFEELFISYDALEKRDMTSRYTYDVTLEQAWGDYTNLLADNDLKVLVIGDSFTKTVCPYLNISYKESRFVHYQRLDVLTAEYVEEYDPDVVILLYYPENMLGRDGLQFNIPSVEESAL